jgi:hypothetical protein
MNQNRKNEPNREIIIYRHALPKIFIYIVNLQQLLQQNKIYILLFRLWVNIFNDISLIENHKWGICPLQDL